MTKTNPIFFQMRLWVVAGAFFFVAAKVPSLSMEQRVAYMAPPAALKDFLFAFRYMVADMFWVRTIQDLDYCEKRDIQNNCTGKTWLSQMLLFTTAVDPWYRVVYSAGALGLSIVISDIAGASRIFHRALEYYPEDWAIVYKAAYHAVWEEKNPAKGAKLMEQAARHGAPDWVYSLATRLYTQAGQKEMAQRLLAEAHQLGLDEKLQQRMRERMESSSPSP